MKTFATTALAILISAGGFCCTARASDALANDALSNDAQATGKATKDPLAKQASWQTPSATEIAETIRRALDMMGVSPDKSDAVISQWSSDVESSDVDPLTAMVRAVSMVTPDVKRIFDASQTSLEDATQTLQATGWLTASTDAMPAPIVASVRAWLGRELVRKKLYDEALPVLDSVEASESIDPASVLFYRAICRHSLLMKKEALADLRRLLENEADSPVRFVRTAHLMVADIKPLKEDSLDEISRLMTDVTRRIDLGRTNDDVQKREQTIIDKLTKLIDKLEEQQQQQQQQQQQSQQSQGQQSQGQQGQPMDDSRIAGANGQGDVDRKKLGERDGWGNLPPAEREEALQQISRDLPTHYREAIEAYFRKLAVDKP